MIKTINRKNTEFSVFKSYTFVFFFLIAEEQIFILV